MSNNSRKMSGQPLIRRTTLISISLILVNKENIKIFEKTGIKRMDYLFENHYTAMFTDCKEANYYL